MIKWLAIILLLISCTPIPKAELNIDKDLPQDYQEAIVEAACRWNEEGANIDVSIVDVNPNVTIGDCNSKIACADPGRAIWFTLNSHDYNLYKLSLHEIGHFLYAEHLKEGNIMQAEWSIFWPDDLTEKDIKATKLRR